MIGDEHQRIVDAVVGNDFDLANELLCNHYKTTGAFVMSYIK
jgi:DNA-binding GntR family transcriptional regulator